MRITQPETVAIYLWEAKAQEQNGNMQLGCNPSRCFIDWRHYAYGSNDAVVWA